MRNNKGQFVKGVSYSPATQFKKGQHWRKRKEFSDKEWLIQEYVDKKRSCGEIAKQFGVTDSAIIFWLKKHNINRRIISESRKVKYWGLSGVDNPMWNKKGELNPRWKGGITQERQLFYQSQEWKLACKKVWERDKATCQRCKLQREDDMGMLFHIHHVVSFVNKELRSDVNNLILLCEVCHRWVHSKKNINGEFIQKI